MEQSSSPRFFLTSYNRSFLFSGPRRGSPARGTPNVLMGHNNQVVRVDPHLVPLTDEAVRQYTNAGGHLTRFRPFGEDPLRNHPSLAYQRVREFHQRYPSFDVFFSSLVNGNNSFVRVSHILSQQLSSDKLFDNTVTMQIP